VIGAAVAKQAAAARGVAAENDMVKRRRSAVVPHAAAAIGPTAGDPHPHGAVLTRIDRKLAAPPF
jgi:hypothetical protein